MKIGLISGEFPPMPGGVGDFTRGLAESLCHHGHEVHILSRSGSTSPALNISAVRGWGPGSLPPIRAWARQLCLDIVNLQYQTAAYDMSPYIHFLPAALDKPLVTTFHDLRHPYLFPKAGQLRDWIVQRLAHSSAGVITTNHEDEILLSGLPNRRLIPIGSSISSADCRDRAEGAARWLEPADADSFVLGHFGFVKAVKGIDYLVEALAALRSAGHDLRLVFIGARRNKVDSNEDADYLRALEDRIERLGLTDAVHWTGYLTDHQVAACFQAIDLMALPFTDGASYRRSSLIAAVHSGCAILTTEPSIPIAPFVHGANLWLVPRCSAAAIEEAILQLMSDHEKLKCLQAGAAKLKEQFDWDLIARETIAFYQTFI